MKIAFIRSWDEKQVGGIESIERELRKGFRKLGIKVKVFSSMLSISFKQAKEFDSIICFDSPFGFDYLTKSRWKEIKRINNNIILVYYTYIKLSKLIKVLKNPILESYANKFVVVSDRMLEMFNGLNVKKILPPVADEYFEIYGKRKPKQISYLGRVDKGKGEEVLKEVWKLKIGGNPVKVLPKTKVLFLPYEYLSKEGETGTTDTPVLILEAMVSGIPILSSNIEPITNLLPKECIFNERFEISDKVYHLEKNFKKVGNQLHKKALKLKVDNKSTARKYLEFINE